MREGPAPGGAARAAARGGAQRARRRRWLVAGAAGLVCAAAALAATLWLGPEWPALLLEWPLRDGKAADGYLSVVVVGLDARAHDPGRTDTIVVATLRLQDGHVGMLWVPRDTRVRLPNGSYNKINLLFSTYGPRALMDALSDLLGMPLDGYVRVDFEAFERLIDDVGGVELTIPRRLRYVDRAQGLFIDLAPGRRRLSGREALQYVRYRADGLGDVSYDPGTGAYFGRVQRQQEFARALLEAVRRPQVLVRLPRLARQLYAMVETDLPLELGLAAAAQVVRQGGPELTTGVLPGMPGTVAGASYWLPDRRRIPGVAQQVLGVLETPGSVAVLNANGVAGSAARVADRLAAAGVRVERVGNATEFGWRRSQVLATSDRALPLARRVAHLLGDLPVMRQEGPVAMDPARDPSQEVVVIVGLDLAGSGARAAAAGGGGGSGGVGAPGAARGPGG
ncbi:MAG TPA: LCP family protein [Limnochordales bacterium]